MNVLGIKGLKEDLGVLSDYHIARKYNVSKIEVFYARKYLDIPPVRRQTEKHREIRELSFEELNKMYEESGSCAKLGEKFDISGHLMAYYLKQKRKEYESKKGME